MPPMHAPHACPPRMPPCTRTFILLNRSRHRPSTPWYVLPSSTSLKSVKVLSAGWRVGCVGVWGGGVSVCVAVKALS